MCQKYWLQSWYVDLLIFKVDVSLYYRLFLLDDVVQRLPDNLTFEFPDDPDIALYKVSVNYELDQPFILEDKIEFRGSSTNSSIQYDKNDKHVDDHEIQGQGIEYTFFITWHATITTVSLFLFL